MVGSALTRREREKQRHRVEILDVAMELLCERGYEHVTMAEVADRAEFAVGTLYKHFQGKEDLLEAMVVDALTRTGAVIRAALASPGNEVERLERMIDALAPFFAERPALARVYFMTACTGTCSWNGKVSGHTREAIDRLQNMVADLLGKGIEKGLLVDVDPRALTAGLQGMMAGVFTAMPEQVATASADDPATLCKRLFLDAVRIKPRIRLHNPQGGPP